MGKNIILKTRVWINANKGRIIKFLISLIFLATILLVLNNNIFAIVNSAISSVTDPRQSDPSSAGVNPTNVNTILKIIRIVSIGSAVILITVDAIKYFTSIDSTDKAEIKRKMFFYFIGGFLIFCATTVYELIANFANEAGQNLG